MKEDKKLGLKVAKNKTEELWEIARKSTEERLEATRKALIIDEAFLLLCESKITKEA